MIIIQIEICNLKIFCIEYIVWLYMYLLNPTAFSTGYGLGGDGGFCDYITGNTFASVLSIKWVLKL
jgi:hypothetical protein